MNNQKLINDYNEFNLKRPLNTTGGPTSSDLKIWEVTIPGPIDSPYEGGKFKVQINFPDDYPNTPPTCYFKTTVFHPNINIETGDVCVNILKKGDEKEKQENKKIWTSKFSACKIILGLYGLLKKPNLEDPLNRNASYLYDRDNKRYFKLAKNFTNKFAK